MNRMHFVDSNQPAHYHRTVVHRVTSTSSHEKFWHFDEGNQHSYGVASLLYSHMRTKLATWLQVSGAFDRLTDIDDLHHFE